MTWGGELKKIVEESGVTDDAEVWCDGEDVKINTIVPDTFGGIMLPFIGLETQKMGELE